MEENLKNIAIKSSTMNTKNILKPWKPIEGEGLQDVMYVEAIHDDYEGFRILLRGEEPPLIMLRVRFEAPLSYRNTQETFRRLDVSQPANHDVLGKLFYIVENSSYIDYFNEMTQELFTDWELKHYVIYASQDCIDVISAIPPIVEWLRKVDEE